MTKSAGGESLWAAYGRALVEVGEMDPRTMVVTGAGPAAVPAQGFRERYPTRCVELPAGDPSVVLAAAGHAGDGHTVFVSSSTTSVVGPEFDPIRSAVCVPRKNVKIFADDGGSGPYASAARPPFLEDLGIMRGLPGMTVVVPADAPSVRGTVLALHEVEGPGYVRLTSDPLPTVTDGTIQIGRAAELRSGGDLTIVAVGALVARALEVARTLAEVGVSTRVLDFASVKPFDEPALLRAARDTGAILVLEEHSVLTGVGALVASTTAENHPVPVRRIGVPDVYVEFGNARDRLDRYGFGVERIRDEAWELLRLRGKVS